MTTASHAAQLFELRAPDFSETPLSAEIDDFDRLVRAHVAKDLDAIVDLIVTGAIVTVGPHELVMVVEDALTCVRVMSVTGTPRSGWVPTAWLVHSDRVRRSAA